MRVLSPLAAIACAVLTACEPAAQQLVAPREPGPDAIGHYCQMTLAEHKGPKGQLLPKGWKDPLWFSSVRDALTYVEQDIVSDKEIDGFWVNDMAQGTWEKPAAGSWIDARTAWYVVESRMSSGMGGSEAVPFKERSAAEAFANENGGRVTDYQSARQAVAETVVKEEASGDKT